MPADFEQPGKRRRNIGEQASVARTDDDLIVSAGGNPADVTGAMHGLGLRDDNAFVEFILNEAGVAVVAGSGFGYPGHMRISFATSDELLRKSIERMERALRSAAAARRG